MALEVNHSTQPFWAEEDECEGYLAQLYDAPLPDYLDNLNVASEETSRMHRLPTLKKASCFGQLQPVSQPLVDYTVNSNLNIGMPHSSAETNTSLNSTLAETSFLQSGGSDTPACLLGPWPSLRETASIEDPLTYPCFAGSQSDGQRLKRQSTSSTQQEVVYKVNGVQTPVRTRLLRHEASASKPCGSTAFSTKASTTKLRKPKTTCTGSGLSPFEDDVTTNKAKRAHSLVERRYRQGLNKGLEELEKALSQAQLPMSPNQSPRLASTRNRHGKKKKSHVLADAMNYIHTSEVDMRHLSHEVSYLSEKVKLLEKLVRCEECPVVAQMKIMRLAC